MAVRDFIAYYNEEEAQYNEMLDDAKDLEQSYREGHLSEEQYDEAIKYIEAIKHNHERLAYVMFLITKRKKYQRKAKVERAEITDNAPILDKLKELKESK